MRFVTKCAKPKLQHRQMLPVSATPTYTFSNGSISNCCRFVLDKDKTKIVDCLVRRRSLYIMAGVSRFDYTHEILADEESFFAGDKVQRERRISVICRCEP